MALNNAETPQTATIPTYSAGMRFTRLYGSGAATRADEQRQADGRDGAGAVGRGLRAERRLGSPRPRAVDLALPAGDVGRRAGRGRRRRRRRRLQRGHVPAPAQARRLDADRHRRQPRPTACSTTSRASTRARSSATARSCSTTPATPAAAASAPRGRRAGDHARGPGRGREAARQARGASGHRAGPQLVHGHVPAPRRHRRLDDDRARRLLARVHVRSTTSPGSTPGTPIPTGRSSTTATGR